MHALVGRREGIVGRQARRAVRALEVDRPGIAGDHVAVGVLDLRVRLKGTPAVTLAGALRRNWLARRDLTMMPPSVPVRLAVLVSVAVIDCVPAVFRVALKVCTPASAAVNL